MKKDGLDGLKQKARDSMERLTERTAVGILVKEDYGEKVLRTLYSCYGGKPNPHYTNCEEGYCAMEKLAAYEDLGYTPEELKLCFDPPEILYKIGNETDGERVYPIYPVDGQQVEFFKGNVYWNCRDDFGDVIEIPLSGLHEEYFLTSEEAEAKLKGVEEKESKDASAWKNHIMNRFMREE